MGKSGCRKHMLLFPYSLYRCPSRNIPQNMRFVFLKLSYSLLQPALSLQERSVVSVDEFQVLWTKLPLTLAVEGEAGESLDVMAATQSLSNRHFIIRNSSRGSPRVQLHFYSLRLHAFLHAALRTANKELEKQLKTGVLSEAAFVNAVEEGEGSRWAYMLQRVFPREEYFSYSELWMSLVQKEMVRDVGEGEWWAMEDGFKTVFLSATVRQENKQAELTLVALLSAE